MLLAFSSVSPSALRLLPRLLTRQWRRCNLLRRLLPLRRPRDAQRRLLGGGEAAQVHLLTAAAHPRLVGLRTAMIVEVHAEVARFVVGHEQRHTLRWPRPDISESRERANTARQGWERTLVGNPRGVPYG